jgi:uncharacterized protein
MSASGTSTATTAGARDHARAQAGTRVLAMPTVPAAAAENLPVGVSPDAVVWEETLEHGEYAGHHLPRGAVVRMTDLDGAACAHTAVHNAAQPSERLNVADTVKVQWQAYPTTGAILLSDMGRALMTIVADSSVRHDAFCGVPLPAGRAALLKAVAKIGLDRRDVHPTISFFRGVRVAPDGALILDDAPGLAGAFVEVRADLDVHVALVNLPHPLAAAGATRASPLRITAWRAEPVSSAADAASPERARAYLNTEDWLAGRG